LLLNFDASQSVDIRLTDIIITKYNIILSDQYLEPLKIFKNVKVRTPAKTSLPYMNHLVYDILKTPWFWCDVLTLAGLFVAKLLSWLDYLLPNYCLGWIICCQTVVCYAKRFRWF